MGALFPSTEFPLMPSIWLWLYVQILLRLTVTHWRYTILLLSRHILFFALLSWRMFMFIFVSLATGLLNHMQGVLQSH